MERHRTYEATGEEQKNANYYTEWYVKNGTVLSRGWIPILGDIDHDGLAEWEQSCKKVVEEGINVKNHEGNVVFKTWASYDEDGVKYESLVEGIEDPEVPQ